MLTRFLSTIVCGQRQFAAGKRLKGVLFFVAFPSSVGLAIHYISRAYGPDATYEGLIGLTSGLLAILIWVYHILDVREICRQGGQGPESGEETVVRPSPAAQHPKAKHSAVKQASILSDELYTRGRIAYLRGAWGEAKDCFERLLRDDRADSDAAFQLGRVHRQLGDARQSERFFRQCQQSAGGAKWAEEIKKYLQENKG